MTPEIWTRDRDVDHRYLVGQRDFLEIADYFPGKDWL